MTTLAMVMSVTMAVLSAEGKEPVETDAQPVAVQKKVPLQPAQLHSTPVRFDRYERQSRVVRFRTPGKATASFSSDPFLLEAGSMAVFEIRSVALTGSVQRWRCVAIHDVAECLGSPVKLRYLPNDTKMVLTATLKPRDQRIEGALASR